MNTGNGKPRGGLAMQANRCLLMVLVLGLGLAGCAGKANKDGSGNSAMTAKGARSAAEQAALERKALEDQKASSAAANQIGARSAAEQAALERKALEDQKASSAAANQIGVRSAVEQAALERKALEETKAADAATAAGHRNGGAGNGSVFPDQLAPDFDSSRDFQKRGFFDEEEAAFAPGLTEAERLAARVEAARRRAGLTDTDEEPVAAFAYGPYSRIYQHDGEVSGLIALDESGKLRGWAAPGELTADGTAFAEGASEKALAQLDAAEGVIGSKGGRRAGSNRNRNGAIDVAASKTNVNEDFIPQTLGGALPMVLGVEENGQFDFDNYHLRDEVKAKLDKLAQQLEGAEYDRLDILGYTDRIGGLEYNKDLSRKRALAVARYLRDRGVPEYKITVTGKGQANPLTQPADCEGLRFEEKIDCLQPDRRVEIEASILRTSVELE